jgi:hypothetical protein
LFLESVKFLDMTSLECLRIPGAISWGRSSASLLALLNGSIESFPVRPVSCLLDEHLDLWGIHAAAAGKRGAHLLLQTRTRTLDGTFRPLFERWYPGLANDNADGATQGVAA